ncbi:MAG: hypothetical protein AB7P69_13635 [Candidatus Binatia bacterium]
MRTLLTTSMQKEEHIRRLSYLFAVLSVLAVAHISVAESDIPDVKGTWVMQVQGVLHHKTQETNPHMHQDVRTGPTQFELTITIDKQDGFRFSGTKESAKLKETVSGVIGFDNKTLYMVEDDGTAFCRLVEPDKMEHIYLSVTKYHSAAGRGILIREK